MTAGYGPGCCALAGGESLSASVLRNTEAACNIIFSEKGQSCIGDAPRRTQFTAKLIYCLAWYTHAATVICFRGEVRSV
jgi:hypothetical protein